MYFISSNPTPPGQYTAQEQYSTAQGKTVKAHEFPLKPLQTEGGTFFNETYTPECPLKPSLSLCSLCARMVSYKLSRLPVAR